MHAREVETIILNWKNSIKKDCLFEPEDIFDVVDNHPVEDCRTKVSSNLHTSQNLYCIKQLVKDRLFVFTYLQKF